ncbi:MAG: hypothetical protein HWN66_11590 [Candidatus Helarchaeota archaeon]|nr:hypothetical protein [Candidatus Helarchaeota archaeon]
MSNDDGDKLEAIQTTLSSIEYWINKIKEVLEELAKTIVDALAKKDTANEVQIGHYFSRIKLYDVRFTEYRNRLNENLEKYKDTMQILGTTNPPAASIPTEFGLIIGEIDTHRERTLAAKDFEAQIEGIDKFIRGTSNSLDQLIEKYITPISKIVAERLEHYPTQVKKLQAKIGEYGQHLEDELSDLEHGTKTNYYATYGKGLSEKKSEAYAVKVLDGIKKSRKFKKTLLISVNYGDVWYIKHRWRYKIGISALIGLQFIILGIVNYFLGEDLWWHVGMYAIALAGMGFHIYLSARHFNGGVLKQKKGEKVFNNWYDWVKWIDLKYAWIIGISWVVFGLFMGFAYYYPRFFQHYIDPVPAFTIGFTFDRILTMLKERALAVTEAQHELWASHIVN